ncbi:MAG: RNA pseudouridine synthase [Bacteriovoracaceae bacterium]|nr:RNA pseudouridine synthase [Bacteriovoracaceae bacterium]
MKFVFKKKYTENNQRNYAQYIGENSELSNDQIDQVIANGGAWVKPFKKKLKRLRGSNYRLKSGDAVEFYFDSEIEFLDSNEIYEAHEFDGFSLWYKPAGVRFQGNKYGDRGSFLNAVGKDSLSPIIIHHLDRNTAGLICIAYKNSVAKELMEMLECGEISLSYRAEVLGHPSSFGIIEEPIDSEPAITSFTRVEKLEKTSVVDVEIETDCHHQIRRHFNFIGHPIMGDHKYGSGNKRENGLQLVAHSINIGESIYSIE